MYELVLRTNDKKIDVCSVIKKIIERHCHNSFYWKKLDTNNYETNFFVCEMEDKRRYVRKKSLNPWVDAMGCPNAIISITIVAYTKSDCIEVSLITCSYDTDTKIVNETIVTDLIDNGFSVKEKNV